QTWPSRSCTGYVRAQPTSGAQAWPLSSAMFQPCSGQVTESPETIPCDSGPPLCGQRSASANTRSAAGRNRAMSSPGPHCTTREPSTGMSSIAHTYIQDALASMSVLQGGGDAPFGPLFGCRRGQLQRLVLARLGAGDACGPGVGQPFKGKQQALVQRAAVVGVLHLLALDVVQAHALDVVHGAVQVVRLLAVQLQERAGVLLHLIGGLHLAQEAGDLGLDAAVAADVDLPARIDRDDAHVLDA